MGKYSRLGKNTLFVFIGNAGAKLISLLMLPCYTRWLSVADYGITDLINVYVALIIGIVTCCIYDSIFIFPKDTTKKKQSEYYTSGILFLTFSLIACGALFFLFKKLFSETSNRFFENIGYIYILLIANSFQMFMQQFARSIDNIRIYSFTGLVQVLFTVLFSFLFIPRWGVSGFIYSYAFSAFIASVFVFVFSQLYQYFNVRFFNFGVLKELLLYSIPLIPNTVMIWLISAINRPIIDYYHGIDQIGIFAVANKFPSLLAVAFYMFVPAWQITVLEEINKTGFSLFFNKILRVITFLSILAFCIISLFSKYIILLFADVKFIQSALYLPILTVGIMFSNMSTFIGVNFSAVKKSKYYFYSTFWGGIVNVIASFILIPPFGIIGCCLSILLSFGITFLIRAIYSNHYVKITNRLFYICVFIFSIIIALMDYTYKLPFIYRLFFYLSNITLCVFFMRKDFYNITKILKR